MFRLLFSAFQRKSSSEEQPDFIISTISPSFVVDSRRLAYDTNTFKVKVKGEC
jgi:hypothetical protein